MTHAFLRVAQRTEPRVVDQQAPRGDPLERLEPAARLDGDLTAVGNALLDRYVDTARAADCSWAQIGMALGVTRQAAHLRFNSRVKPPAPRWPSSFSEAVHRVIGLGAEHARSWRLGHFGTEHVLLALTQQPGDPAAAMLRELGLTPETVGSMSRSQMRAHPTADPASRRRRA